MPHRAFLDVELKGRHDRAVVEVLAAGRGPGLVNAVVSSFEPGTLERVAGLVPYWPRWLNARDLEPETIAVAAKLECRRSPWSGTRSTQDSLARARAAGPRRRGLDRAPPRHGGPARAAGRDRDVRGGRLRSTAEACPRRDDGPERREPTAYPVDAAADGRHDREDRMTDRADLVVVGAGTIGGWASVFAAEAGVGRVVVLERGLAGMGASSRAAGIVRAQGGTPATVALGRWSIDFYRGQAARLRHRLRLPRAGLPDPRRHRRGRTAGPRARRDAARRRPDRCPLAGRRPRRPRPSARSRRTAIGAAASGTATATSTRRATSAPTRWRCRRPASSCANGRRSPALRTSRRWRPG